MDEDDKEEMKRVLCEKFGVPESIVDAIIETDVAHEMPLTMKIGGEAYLFGLPGTVRPSKKFRVVECGNVKREDVDKHIEAIRSLAGELSEQDILCNIHFSERGPAYRVEIRGEIEEWKVNIIWESIYKAFEDIGFNTYMICKHEDKEWLEEIRATNSGTKEETKVDADIDALLKSVEESSAKENKSYKLILFNDNVNDIMDVLVQVIKATKCSAKEAERIVAEAHTQGRAIAMMGSLEEVRKAEKILMEIDLKTQVEEA